MNVIDARDIFSKKKINQEDIEDKQSIMNIENAMIEISDIKKESHFFWAIDGISPPSPSSLIR